MAQPSNASLPDIVFSNERNRSKGSQANINKPATAVNAKIDTVSYTNSTHTNDTNVSTEAPAAASSTHKQNAIDYWNNAEKNASNFPEAFGARLMRLNAETGYDAASGAKTLYETLTDWNKFKSAVDGMYNTVANPKETYKALRAAAQSFSDLPVDQKGEAAYKMLLGTLAGGGVAKAGAATVGKKVVPNKINMRSADDLMGVELASPELISAVSKKRDVVIAQPGSEELRMLDYFGAEASVGGANNTHILLRENPSKAALLEEF